MFSEGTWTTLKEREQLEITLGPYAVQTMSEISVFHVFVLAWLIKV